MRKHGWQIVVFHLALLFVAACLVVFSDRELARAFLALAVLCLLVANFPFTLEQRKELPLDGTTLCFISLGALAFVIYAAALLVNVLT